MLRPLVLLILSAIEHPPVGGRIGIIISKVCLLRFSSLYNTSMCLI